MKKDLLRERLEQLLEEKRLQLKDEFAMIRNSELEGSSARCFELIITRQSEFVDRVSQILEETKYN